MADARHARKFTLREEQQIAAEYRAGATLYDLRRKWRATVYTFYGVLARQGVPLRAPGPIRGTLAAADPLPDFKRSA
jgi:hypothetical protein